MPCGRGGDLSKVRKGWLDDFQPGALKHPAFGEHIIFWQRFIATYDVLVDFAFWKVGGDFGSSRCNRI